MKWLTISQIERRSKTAKGALKVSYERWNQLYTATAEELRKEYERNSYIILGSHCGLCIYYTYKFGKYDKCENCLLFQGDISKRCGGSNDLLWLIAYRALSNWIEKKGKWQEWKQAAKALRDKLKELMEV